MISFDASTNGGSTTGTSLSFSHTCSGNNRVLFVATVTDTANNTDYITGVTYNGVAMSQVGTFSSPGLGGVELYILVNPASGVNTVTVSLSSSVTIYAVASSYTGALQSGQPDATNQTATDPTTTLSVNTSTVADNCWIISCAGRKAGSTANITAGTGVTSRQINSFVAIGDSNGPKTPAGTYSSAWDMDASTGISVITASVSPFPDSLPLMYSYIM